jgi:uncharacterized protein (DUF433 family)
MFYKIKRCGEIIYICKIEKGAKTAIFLPKYLLNKIRIYECGKVFSNLLLVFYCPNKNFTKMRKEDNFKVVPAIGEGMYFPIDVSEILRLEYHKVKYLMDNFWLEYTFGEKRNKAINFYSLIEFYTYYHLRDKGYTSHYIKKFHQNLSKNMDTPYPFASIRVVDPKSKHHKTRSSKIWYEYMGEIMRDDRINQPAISSFVKPFLQRVIFGDDLLAQKFFPFKHSNNVVVDPSHQFGKPVINGTNLQTKTIYRLSEAGESQRNICILYDISEAQVHDAIRLHTRKVA